MVLQDTIEIMLKMYTKGILEMNVTYLKFWSNLTGMAFCSFTVGVKVLSYNRSITSLIEHLPNDVHEYIGV